MAFTSLSFLFLFLPLVMIAVSIMPPRLRNYGLSFFSLLFILWSGPYFSIVLIASVIINWLCGLYMLKDPDRHRRKIVFILIMVLNIMPLLTFKYSGFFIQNANVLLSLAGIKPLPCPLILPLGFHFILSGYFPTKLKFSGESSGPKGSLSIFSFTAPSSLNMQPVP